MPSRKHAPAAPLRVRATPLDGRTHPVFYRDAKGVEPVDVFLEAREKTQLLEAAKTDELTIPRQEA